MEEMDTQTSRPYEPELAMIRIKGSDRVFTMPVKLLISKSAYFRKVYRMRHLVSRSPYFAEAFQECYKEGRVGIIELEDVEEWALECFISWIDTGRVFWRPFDDKSHAPALPDPDAKDPWKPERDLDDAVTWGFPNLFHLYIFADDYDTRAFRNDIMDIILVKGLQTEPREYLWPHMSIMAEVFDFLPDTSPLFRLLLEVLVHSNPRADAEEEVEELMELGRVNGDVLLRICARRGRQVDKLKCLKCEWGVVFDNEVHADVNLLPYYDTDEDMCRYHEHNTEEEKKDCERKWKDLRKERGIEIYEE